jgi:uncharacterized repeat protein (TIGR01451 family)
MGRANRPARRSGYRPVLEALEERTVLSSFLQTFQGSATQFTGNQAVNTFLGGSFNESTSFGSIHHVALVGSFGAAVDMSLSGKAGLDLNFSGDGGGVTAAYSATLNQDFAQPTGFGQFVTFDPSNTNVAINSGTLTTTSPSFGYGASADLALSGSLGAKFAVGDTTSASFNLPGGSLNIPLFSMNNNNDGIVSLLGYPIIAASPGLGLSPLLQKSLGTLEDFALSYELKYPLSADPPLRLRLKLNAPQNLDFTQDLQLQLGTTKTTTGPGKVPIQQQDFDPNAGLDLGSLEELAPVVNLNSTQLQDGGMISASGQGTVAQLSLQLGALTGPLLGLPALSALSDTDSIDLDVVRADFTPVSFQLQPTIYAAQSASVQPLSQLTYNFSAPVVVTLNGQPVRGGNPVTSVTFTPGKDTVGVQFEGQPITVTPTWTFQEVYHYEVDLNVGLDATLTVGEIKFHVPALGDFTFGPLYQKQFDFADATLQNLFNQSSTILNQQVTLAPFTIGGNFQLSTAVTTTADSNMQGSGSLRFAVLSANAMASPTPVVIQLGAGTYNLTLAPNGTNDGAHGNLVVTAPNLIIVGAGPGQTTINASGLGDRVFHMENGAQVKLVGVAITGGDADYANDVNGGFGGGILQDAGSSLELDDCWVTGNTAPTTLSNLGQLLNDVPQGGGGIGARGSLTIRNSTISNNVAGAGADFDASGGGVLIYKGSLVVQGSTITGNTVHTAGSAYGGGVAVGYSSATIDSSTLSNNTANGETSGGTGPAYGGGLCAYAFNGLASVRITNSTFFGNQATSGSQGTTRVGAGGYGGALAVPNNLPVYLINDTVAANSASSQGGGISTTGPVTMKNTIVANNMAGGAPDDMSGSTVYSAGNNLIETTASVTAWHNLQFSSTGVATASTSGFDPTDLLGVDPRLGTFGNHGGPTQTLPLLPGSPAIDAGGNTFAIPGVLPGLPSTDQRGLPRAVNGTVDIGAVEYQYDLALTGSEGLVSFNEVSYSFTLQNNGPDSVSGITVSDLMPGGETFLSSSAPAGWTTSAPSVATTGTVTFTLNSGSTFTPGQTTTFTVQEFLASPPLLPVSNAASIGPAPWDTSLGNNQVTETVFGEGQAFTNATLAWFQGPTASYTSGDFTAFVQWGDGSSNSSTDGSGALGVVADPLGGFDVVASHTYAESANYVPQISVSSTSGGVNLALNPRIAVADQPLNFASPGDIITSLPPVVLHQTLQNTVLYHFIDPNANLTPGSFQATAYWGDGTSNQSNDGTGSVSVVADPVGGFDVFGTHQYPGNVQGAMYAVRVVDASGLELDNPVLLHFTDANPTATASDFTATVLWGDGLRNSSSDGTPSVVVVANPTGGFDVLGAHAYTQTIRDGSFTVDVRDAEGSDVAGYGRISVDYPLTAGPLTVPSVHTEGDHIQGMRLFGFIDSDPQGQASDFTVNVLWGDGTGSTSADGSVYVLANGDGSFYVYGNHTFEEARGGTTFAVLVQDISGAVTGATATLPSVSDPAVQATGAPTINAVEGSSTGPMVVATFTDPGGPEATADYAADINWGDGTGTQVGAGSIVANADGSFSVVGSHGYTQPGTRTIAVTIHHDSAADALVTTSVVVSDPPAAVQGGVQLGTAEGTALSNQVLATFSDPGGADPLGDYGAVIDWGDGSKSTGTVTLASNTFGSFASPLPTGHGPVAVVAADLNGDGKIDLVTANALDGTVQVYLGNGDETFQPPQTYALGTSPAGLAVGDLNGEDKPDIVTANPQNNTVSVLLNNGDGTFTFGHTLSTGGSGLNPSFVTLADLYGDGRLNVITANPGSGTVSVFLGNADGTFQSPETFASGGQDPVAVAVGDLNGDGVKDLVVADQQSDQISVLLGNRNGAFQVTQTLAVGSLPSSVSLADLRGSGRLDIIAANAGSNNLSVLLGNGDGTFQSAVNYATGTVPVAVLAADLNGDGTLDLSTANNGSNSVSVLQGNGDGTFRTATQYGTGTAPSSVAAADVNGDGKLDLITANQLGDSVSLLLPSYAVVDSHVYAEEGTYTITVFVLNGGSTTATSDTVTVSEPPINGASVPLAPLVVGQTSAAVEVATFTHANGVEPTGGFTATVDWGIAGHHADAATVTQDTGGTYHVKALPPALSVGSYTATVSIREDNLSTTVTDTLAVNKANTTTSVSSSAAPSVSGQAVILTVTANAPGSGTPTGAVTFYDAGVSIGTAALGGAGTATLTTSTLSTGTHSITAAYTSGDANFNASPASAILPQGVNPANTTTSLAASVNSTLAGQTVTFTATVAISSPGTSAVANPTGTVTFYDNGLAIGTGALSGTSTDTATFTTSTLASTAAHSITAAYTSGDANFNLSAQSPAIPVTVVGVIVSKPTQTYADLETYTATISSVLMNGAPPASSVSFYVSYGSGSWQYIGTVYNNGSCTTFTPVPGETVTPTSSWSTSGGVITATLGNVPLLADTAGALSGSGGEMAPGAHTVKAVFGGNPNFILVPTTALTVKQRGAVSTYSGALFVSTSSPTSGTATVTLAATVQDPAALSSTAGNGVAPDSCAGDIRNAQVTFINRDTGAVIASGLPVGLVSAGDTRTGTATCNWTVSIGNSSSQQFTIGILVTNYYTDSSSREDTVVTVSLPLTTGFITGGGYLTLTSSGGLRAGDVGTKNNFGFNVKFNKGGANLQGNLNTIVRRTEADGIQHVYQIKANSMTSLATGTSSKGYPTATFTGKANISDITDPLNVISIDGNATLQVTMTDVNGTGGSGDTLGITLWDKSGGLWYSSNWSGTMTVQQALAGGDLVVHSAQLVAGGPAPDPGSASALTPQALQPIVQEAIALWREAGVPEATVAALEQTPVEIADLPDGYLGRMTEDGIITIDMNAAGYGWSLGATPAAGRVDLLTVVAHELGHVVGVTELTDPNDLMYVYLAPGVRRVPTAADVLAARLPVTRDGASPPWSAAPNQPLGAGAVRDAGNPIEWREVLDLVLSAGVWGSPDDFNPTALAPLMMEGGRSDETYPARANPLSGSAAGGRNDPGGLPTADAHVAIDDRGFDATKLDWFFADLNGSNRDAKNDLTAGEVVTAL